MEKNTNNETPKVVENVNVNNQEGNETMNTVATEKKGFFARLAENVKAAWAKVRRFFVGGTDKEGKEVKGEGGKVAKVAGGLVISAVLYAALLKLATLLVAGLGLWAAGAWGRHRRAIRGDLPARDRAMGAQPRMA